MKHDFDIREFGGTPDGETLNTGPLQRAIDACHKNGGGRVVCGPGTWMTGSVELKSHVNLHLAPGSRIVGSGRIEDYTPLVADGFFTEKGPEKSAHGLLWAADARDLEITGSGTVDGAGLAFYDDSGGTDKLNKPETPRPRIGMFYRCRDLRIEGVTLVDCACWTLWLMQCERVRVRGIVIRGNRRMRNVDGIDVDACRDVSINDCLMDTEDDCIAIRAIRPLYTSPAVCENVVVTNCVLKSGCQGVRVGCPGDAVIRDSAFSNLVIESAGNGILFQNPRVNLPPDSPARADISNIVFSNVVIRCNRWPIKLSVETGIKLKRLSDISFSNFRIHSGGPCIIQGCPETIIRNIRFSNMKIETTGDDAIQCRYCDGIQMNGVELCNRYGLLTRICGWIRAWAPVRGNEVE